MRTTTTLLTSDAHRAGVRARALNDFKGHVITTVIDDSEKRVHVFRCAQLGTGNLHFYVSVLPGAILVHGDIGELLIDHPSGGIGWLRGSVESSDYFLGKAYKLKPTEFMPGDAEAYLADEEWRSAETRAAIRENWTPNDDDPGRAWAEAVYDATGDPDIPYCLDYTFETLWCYEALRWFVRNYVAAEVTAA